LSAIDERASLPLKKKERETKESGKNINETEKKRDDDRVCQGPLKLLYGGIYTEEPQQHVLLFPSALYGEETALSFRRHPRSGLNMYKEKEEKKIPARFIYTSVCVCLCGGIYRILYI
jgi:hypothetical protein